MMWKTASISIYTTKPLSTINMASLRDCLLPTASCLLGGGGFRFGEVAGLDDGDLRRVDVTAQGGDDPGRRQRQDALLELGVPGQCAVPEEVARQPASQLAVLGARD